MSALKLAIVLAMTAVASQAVTSSMNITVIGADGATSSKSINVGDFPAADGKGNINVEIDFDDGDIAVGAFTGSISALDSLSAVVGTPVTFEGTMTASAPALNLQPVPVFVQVVIG